MKVNFALIHFLTQNFALFFFSFVKFVVKLKFFRNFSVLANFYRKTLGKFALYVNRNTGKRRAITSVIHFLLLCLSLILYRRISTISFSLPIFWRGRDRGVSHRVYIGTPFSLLARNYLLLPIRPLAKANFSLICPSLMKALISAISLSVRETIFSSCSPSLL